MKRIELLAPAKNKHIGKVAIDNGADAVYIGAPSFGARQAAGNSLEDIQELVDYAHQFYVKVYVTLNTLLYDNELAEAEQLIARLYAIGVDALIVQDMGILRMNIPPIALHASTQMHNYEPERIRFLDELGFSRIVLARELGIDEMREIRRHTKAELEVFVHGALCVSLSGQCYMSEHMFGRSANRGACAQPCRQKWNVVDRDGKVLVKDEHILSLRDMNRSEVLNELVDMGVDSLKVEGRLKDEVYVANVIRYYSQKLEALATSRTSSGYVKASFVPAINKSFNRGYIDYFAHGRNANMVNRFSPKSMGQLIGKVAYSKGIVLKIADLVDEIHNGDGLCYIENNELKGIRVNVAKNNEVACNEPVNIPLETLLYRNYDRVFEAEVTAKASKRVIAVSIDAYEEKGYLHLSATDSDGNHVNVTSSSVYETAQNPQQKERLLQALSKCGDTIFECQAADYHSSTVLFIPAAQINELRRRLLDLLLEERLRNRPQEPAFVENKAVQFPGEGSWRLNVVNQLATSFYESHGVKVLEKGAELRGLKKSDVLMQTRYCILNELGYCMKKTTQFPFQFPLTLQNAKEKFDLIFDCKHCCMKIVQQE